jgi:hypothetical protein
VGIGFSLEGQNQGVRTQCPDRISPSERLRNGRPNLEWNSLRRDVECREFGRSLSRFEKPSHG